MVKKLFVIFLLTFCNISFGQNISAKASVDSTSYLVGDYIHYNISVNYDKTINVIKPQIQDSLKNVDLIKINDPVYSEKDNRKSAIFNYTLSVYDSADVTIPSISIQYRVNNDTTVQSTETNPVSFSVRLVNVDLKKDIKDVKDPQKIPFDWTTLIIWIVIGLIVIGILIFLYMRYKRKKSDQQVVKKVIKLPPHVIAMKSLNALEEKKLWQNGKIKEYHSEITEIIRRYFADRFGLKALELTTSETLEHLRSRKDAEIILSTTENFLNNADLVKFAKFSPLESVNEEMMKQAVDIVKKTTVEEKKSEEEKPAEVNNV